MSKKDSGKKRDDSYFAAQRRKRKKYTVIVIPIIIALVAAGAAAAFLFPRGNTPDTSGFGPLGSAHEHAVFAVILDGQQVDFSQSRYQVKSQYIHVEGGDGTTLHRHATNVPFGAFLQSMNMQIQEDTNCFINDSGSRFCDDGNKRLRFFVNGTETESINGYVLEEEDRMLVIYGSQPQEQIQAEIERLEATPVKK